MEVKEILKKVDYTLLRPEATWPEVRELCNDAYKYGVASVCVSPAHLANAVQYLNGNLPACTVVGFPGGFSTTYVKCFEADDAIKNGAEEIDMVVNLGWVKAGHWDWIAEEILGVKGMCAGHTLKVIFETCLLTQDEKIKLCEVATSAGADYVKTSTGFSTGGATLEDVKLMKKHVGPHVKVKAAGGIRTLADAEKFLECGADRIGSSSILEEVKAMEQGK